MIRTPELPMADRRPARRLRMGSYGGYTWTWPGSRARDELANEHASRGLWAGERRHRGAHLGVHLGGGGYSVLGSGKLSMYCTFCTTRERQWKTNAGFARPGRHENEPRRGAQSLLRQGQPGIELGIAHGSFLLAHRCGGNRSADLPYLDFAPIQRLLYLVLYPKGARDTHSFACMNIFSPLSECASQLLPLSHADARRSHDRYIQPAESFFAGSRGVWMEVGVFSKLRVVAPKVPRSPPWLS